MIRKFLLGMVLLPISLSSWSIGPYIGLGVGPDLIDFHQNAHISQLNNFNVIDKTHLAASGVFGSLFAGYARQYNGFYLAGEVNGNISSTRFKSENDEFIHLSFAATKYKINSNYGISVLPGYLYSNTLLFFGRLGYTNGHFKSITSDVSLANVSRNLDGFRAGLGMKQMLNPHWGVRMEYSHIEYSKVHFSALDNGTKTTSIYPQANQFEFGIIYNFDAPTATFEK
jgi:outer membrane immunogenic protein